MKKPSRGILLGLACTLLFACTNSNNDLFADLFGDLFAGRPTIATDSLPDGVIGQAYSATLQAGGGVPPLTWSISSGSLPAGLSLASSTGVISGTPTGPAGTATFTVQVTDSAFLRRTTTRQLLTRHKTN